VIKYNDWLEDVLPLQERSMSNLTKMIAALTQNEANILFISVMFHVV